VTREMIRASARSRSGSAGPSRAGGPSRAAMAATCPCGSDRVIVTVCPGGTNAVPFSAASIESAVASGRPYRLGSVSCLTLPPSP
jgi:hypothetical protein